MSDTLKDIETELQRPADDNRTIDKEIVRGWMAERDREVVEATYSFLHKPSCVGRVVPALELDDVFDWMLDYFALNLTTDPASEWGEAAGGITLEVIAFFIRLWDEGREFRGQAQYRLLRAQGLHVGGQGALLRGDGVAHRVRGSLK